MSTPLQQTINLVSPSPSPVPRLDDDVCKVDGATSKKKVPRLEYDSDDSVVEVDAAQVKRQRVGAVAGASSSSAAASSSSAAHEECTVICSNGQNALVDFAHARWNCYRRDHVSCAQREHSQPEGDEMFSEALQVPVRPIARRSLWVSSGIRQALEITRSRWRLFLVEPDPPAAPQTARSDLGAWPSSSRAQEINHRGHAREVRYATAVETAPCGNRPQGWV